MLRVRNSLRGSLRGSTRKLATQATHENTAVLSNGVRVIASPSPGHFNSLGVFVDAGSRFESEHEKGVSHLVDRLSFKSTKDFTGSQILETLELLGGNFSCSSSRESMMYHASVFSNETEKMFHLLTETVRNPLITNDEVLEQLHTARYEIDEIWRKSNLILPELFHTTAYSGKTLGSPLLCPHAQLDRLSRNDILSYRAKLYNPQSIVAAFVGISIDEAVRYAEKYLGDMQQTTDKVTPPTAVYTGGEYSMPMQPAFGGQQDLVHLYLGFEGLSLDDPDIYALSALQTLLGGGGSFSAGGPGKGMYSRLYTQVLNRHYYIENCTSFINAYSDSGLFGISASSIPDAAPYLAHIICKQLSQLFASGEGRLTEREVARAKNQLRSALLMNLESRAIELEDIGRQVQQRGYRIPVSEMVSKIESLTVEDLRRVAERVFTGKANNKGNGSGKPTIVVQGDRKTFGDIEDVVKSYGLGVPCK